MVLFSNKNKKRKGFTLIELLVIILVLSLVMALTVVVIGNVINKTKEKSYKVTVNNVENVSSGYIQEYYEDLFWLLDPDDGSTMYQCITVQNLIDVGYFKNDVLNSKIAENRNLSSDDKIYVEIDGTKKNIKKIVLLSDGDSTYSTKCKKKDLFGDVNITTTSGWAKEKEVTIIYKISLAGGLGAGFKYEYKFSGDSSIKKSATDMPNLEHKETVVVKRNGTMTGTINVPEEYSGEKKISATKKITKIDIEGPNLSGEYDGKKVVTNEVTIPIKITDTDGQGNKGSGIDKAGFTKSDLNVKVNNNKINDIKLTLDKCNKDMTECYYNLNIKNTAYDGEISVTIDEGKFYDKVGNPNKSASLISGVSFDNSFKIIYDANGGKGTMESQECRYGNSCTLNKNKFTRAKYTFVGWSTNPTDNVAMYNDGYKFNSLKRTSDLKLYAIWRINTVTIKYSVNGGKITSDTPYNDYSWSSKDDIVYMDSNELVSKINSGLEIGGNGLVNYNNSNYVKITKKGNTGVSGAEWECLSGCTESGKKFDQLNTTYKSSDFCDVTNGDCTVVLGVNWRLNTVKINYSANGGDITSSTTTKDGILYYWKTIDDIVYRKKTGGDYSILTSTVKYGNKINLVNYNNSKNLQIKRDKYKTNSREEWKCLSGCTTSGKVFDHIHTDYNADEFCNVSDGDCTVVLGVNWVLIDATPPTCTINATDGSTNISVTYKDNDGGSGIAYYGWNSSYSGTKIDTKTIDSTGTITYYVMDNAGNKGSCSATIEGTNSASYCSYGEDTGGGCKSCSGSGCTYSCVRQGVSGNFTASSDSCSNPYPGHCGQTGTYCSSWSYFDYQYSYSCSSDYIKLSDSYCFKKN